MNEIKGKILTPIKRQTAFGPLVYIAAPWRRGFELQSCAVQFLARYAGGRQLNVAHTQPPKGMYNRARDVEEWQRFYMELAYKRGAILFWLPAGGDLQHDERLSIRYLLGRWMTRDFRPRIVVVINGGAEGASAIHRDILAVNPNVTVVTNLKVGCQMAIRIAMVTNLYSGFDLPAKKELALTGPGCYREGISTDEIDSAWDDIAIVEKVYRLEHRIPSPQRDNAVVPRPMTQRKSIVVPRPRKVA